MMEPADVCSIEEQEAAAAAAVAGTGQRPQAVCLPVYYSFQSTDAKTSDIRANKSKRSSGKHAIDQAAAVAKSLLLPHGCHLKFSVLHHAYYKIISGRCAYENDQDIKRTIVIANDMVWTG
jgi:hypothetical protein